MIRSAALGGLFIGVLSALPIIGAANCCCCLWIVAGGTLAAYLEQQRVARTVTPGEGAAVGALAGVLGALIWIPVAVAIGIVMGPVQRAMMAEILRTARDMPPEAREVIEGWGGQGSGLRYVLGFGFQLFVGTLFSTLGGVLGAAYFRRDVPPALGGTYAPPLPPTQPD